jgi:YfiR/HmsC-like
MAASRINEYRHRRFPCWALAAALTGNQPTPVPMPIQLPLVLKVLTAERNRPLEARPVLVIGIVFQRTSRESREVKDRLVAEIENRTVNDWAAPVRFGLIDVSNPRDLASGVATTKPGILYVCPLPGFDIGAIVSLSRARKILTFTGVPAFVKSGLSVGFGSERGETKIIINRTASLAEGADFSSKLLKLAEVIE